VWVPGCSTGEEVYSLAILLIERLGDRRPLQLFGTDLSEKAIDAARIGRYPEAIAKKISAERLERFFRREDGGYRIKQDVRERCVFARHDLVSDPPFSKLDLVSCRNLLIYLGAPLQQRVIPIVHYALNQVGFLLLGRAETIGEFESLFTTIDSDARIYARKPGVRAALTFPTAGQLGRLPWQQNAGLRSAVEVQRDVDHVLLARYAPPCVLVDDNFDVLQFRGHTGMYLEPPPGQPQLNLLRMARDGLTSELPLALQRARRTDATVRKEGVVVRDHRREHRLHLEVIPVRGPTEGKRHFLVVFEPVPDAAAPPKRAAGKTPPANRTEVQRLRHELSATKEYLSSVVTLHLATSEELAVTNEELQSSNEELQSSNEEIQTAKEELQSSNEELETVNEELQHGNDQLRETNDDLVNVLASIEIAMIIVDTDRRVRRFTPRARSVLNLIAGDLGRPIADLQPNLDVARLDATIEEVIDTLVVHESEVLSLDGGTSYRMQIRPYLTVDRKISGAVLSFVDITALRAARNLRTAIVETVPTPIVVLDERLRVQSSNRAFGEAFHTTEAKLIGRALIDLGAWTPPELVARLQAVVTSGTGLDELDVRFQGSAGERVLRISAHRIPQTDGPAMILVGMLDITERETARLERDAFLDAVSHELRTPLSAILLWAQALRTLDHADPQRIVAIETIIDSVRSEARIVDDLLDIALSRSTELAVVVEVVDAAAVVTQTIEAARKAARVKQVSIESSVAPGRIAVDPRRLGQITMNLIENGIKFTPAGGTVTVDLSFVGGAMELRVRDTGPGVAPERLALVFEPFAKPDGSSTRAHAGLGIGLALVRHLVERHGGTIEVTSPGVGRGSTFTVRIPERTAS
jgi:two-component system CheB/CheR fusion protein